MKSKQIKILCKLFSVILCSYALSSFAQDSPISGFEQALKDKGWSVHRNTNGDIILNIPNQPKQSQTESSDDSLSGMTTLANELTKGGWNVQQKEDGSLVFFIQEQLQKTKKSGNQYPDCSSQIEAYKKSVKNSRQDGCLGSPPPKEIVLPVDTWQKAYDVSKAWLNKQSIKQVKIGKIRQIFNVYLVSIVKEKAPFALIHQIAIKTKNGNAISLY